MSLLFITKHKVFVRKQRMCLELAVPLLSMADHEAAVDAIK